MPALAAWTPDHWTALGTVIYAVVAIAAAFVVWFQLREARRTREDQSRPFVVVDIQPGTAWYNAFNLVVENIGKTLAKDVHIRFDPPIATTLDQYDLAGSVILQEGIPWMPPGRRIVALFDLSHQRLKSDLPMRYDVTVQYSDARGKRQGPLNYVIDLSYLFGLQRLGEYGMHDAAKALREMAKVMKRGVDVHGRWKVWVRDEDKRIEEENVEMAMTGHYPTLGRKGPSDLVMALGRNVVVRSAVTKWREVFHRNGNGASR